MYDCSLLDYPYRNLSFSYKIYVLDVETFFEDYCPVGIIYVRQVAINLFDIRFHGVNTPSIVEVCL